MTLLESIMLGIVQGLTEFLPVSSKGHLALFQHFMPDFSQPGVLFDVVLHLGTVLAVLIYFRERVLAVLKDLRLLARAVFIVDRDGIVKYAQVVPEVSKEPDYEEVLHAVKAMV